MYSGAKKRSKKNGTRFISLMLTVVLAIQLLGIDITALGASPYAFRGYNSENVTASTFEYAYSSETTVSGRNVTMDDDGVGEAIGYIALDDADDDISESVDLGGLEIDFSTTTVVTEEGEGGILNDVPAIDIYFCSDSNFGGAGSANVLKVVTLSKSDNTVPGSVALSSGASIPFGTRALFVYLTGTNTVSGSDNTIEFQNLSLIIHDAETPSCTVDYDSSWTSGSVVVTVEAADSDSGLEGIYIDGSFVTATSPHTFTATGNMSFSAYSKDLSGKVSDTVNTTIDNIDTDVPGSPVPMTLSHETWTSSDVTVTMPELGATAGSPEKYIYQIGSGAWQDFISPLTYNADGISNISIAVADEAGNVSGTVDDIIYIDKQAPSIDDVSQTVSSGSCIVDVDVSDAGLSGIDALKYATGSHDAAYFESGGNAISGGTFAVSTGGTFTIFVSDNAGNHDIGEYEVNTAPSLVDITDKSVEEDGSINVAVTVSDNETARENLVITASAEDGTLVPDITINQEAAEVSLDIVPEPDMYGSTVITVEVTDAQSETVSDTFTLTVTSQNDPPTAVDDSGITVAEDASVTIDVLANDYDSADGDTLTISDPGTPVHGSAEIDSGIIVYTPNENYNGSDSFIYTIGDGNGGSATATVSVTVTAAADAPAAVDDSAETAEDTPVTIDVLLNDTDADLGDEGSTEVLTIVAAEDGAHGTTAIVSGEIVYTPNEDWSGTDSFDYTISDTTLTQSTATVTVTVSSVNDAPQFAGLDAAYTISEDSIDATISFSITDVETAADSLMLQAVSLDESMLACCDIEVIGLGDNDDAISLVMSPMPDMHGDVTIRLSLGDGFETIVRDITLTISAVNDAPDAGYDTLYFDEDTVLTIETSTLLENDTDIEGDTLSFAGINTNVGVGTLTAVDGDTYEYTPPANYDGTTTFTYLVSDGTDTSIGTCELIARAGNDAPIITVSESSYTTNEDTTKSDIVFNISDQETDPENLIVKGGSGNTGLVSTDGIAIVNNGDGTCTMSITPMDDANGTCVITVTVSDGDKKDEDSFSFVIAPMPDAPVAVGDYAYIPLSGELTFDVVENDRDVDGDSLTVIGFDDSLLPGHLTFDTETQQFTYNALVGETGISTFTYTISDGDATTANATATVTLDVHTVTHPPVISAIANKYITEDGNTGNIPFSVSDIDYGDTITISVSSSNTTLLPENFTENIIVTDNGDGTYFLYLEPAANGFGVVTVTVTATDSTSNTDTETLILHVYAQNDAPTAVNDTVTTTEDHSVTLPVLSNDSDPEGDTIYVNYIEWPSHGTLTRSGDTYTYYPYSNYNGTETLTYTISDGQSTATAEVTITVSPVNDAPIARSNWIEIANTPGANITFNVISNDYDVDSATIRVSEIILPVGFCGNVVDNGNGTLTYTRVTASGLANGRDDFQYTIVDIDPDTGDPLRVSNEATVYIGVDFVTSLTAYSRSVYCYEDDAPFIIDMTSYIENPNGVSYDLTIDETTALGTFTVIDNTHVSFDPAPDANGYQSITYSVTESGGGESDTGEIGLRVYAVNDAPIIDSAPASASCDEDDSTTFTVTFSDVDDAADDLHFFAYGTNRVSTGPIPLSVSVTESRTGGSALVTVTPAADTFGELDLVVHISDGFLYDTHTVHMTVNPVDDAPKLFAVSESLYEDTDITFGVITSDCDVDGDILIVFIADGDDPAHGTVTVDANGTITYTPDENYFGTDTFVYSVKDDTLEELSSTATATMVVIPINDPPIITNLDYYYTTNEDTTKVVTLTVTDVDNDLSGASSYTITSDNTDLIPNENISIAHVSGYGMAITLVPADNEFGVAVISITATDGTLSTLREFQLTVLSVNDIPVAVDDVAAVNEQVAVPATETSVMINVLGNDSDVEDTQLQVAEISNITEGRVVNNENGTVTYYVDGDHSGVETFDYTVVDDNGATDTATVTVTITPMNDPPLAEDDEISIAEDDTAVTIDVLVNDSDTEDDTLTITVVSNPANGTATTDGAIVTYTPDANYFGDDSIAYTISDGNGGTDTGLVSIEIAPRNDAPTLEKHTSSSGDWEMDEDATESFSFAIDDVETPFHNLIVEIISLNEAVIKTTSIVLTSGVDYKTITVTPELHMSGTVPVRISVSDGAATTTKTYDILVNPVNDAPEITTPPVTTTEDTSVGGSVSATDIENDTLTFTKATDPAHGSVTVYGNGTYTYTPDDNYNGEDSFDVTVSDGAATSTGTVSVTVTPISDAPTAADDTATTNEDTAISIDVLANDTDVDADPALNETPDTTALTISLADVSLADPSHGSIEVVAGEIVYTPSLNYNGTDTFEYNAYDGQAMGTATVTVTIGAVNDAPTADDATRTINEDTSALIAWAGITDDVDGDSLTVEIDTGASNGTAAVVGVNITYTPAANWYGTDSFTYTVTDGEYTDGGTITITVQSVNDPPQFAVVPDAMTLTEDGANGSGNFTVTDIETPDGDLVVTVLSSTNTGLVGTGDVALTPNGDGTWSLSVDPNDNKNGSATISLRVTDGSGGSSTCQFAVSVSAVNDAPSGGDDTISTNEDTPKTFNAIANDDVDLNNEGDTLTITAVGTAAHGTAVSNGNGTITYTPSLNYNGPDAFTYSVQDAAGESATFNVTVTVAPVNDLPVITPSSLPDVTTNEDTISGAIEFTVNDVEDDDSTLSISAVAISNSGLVSAITMSDVTDDARSFTIMPSENLNGTATIRVTVTDSNSGTDTDTFDFIVSPVNDAPANGDDTATTNEDTSVVISVLVNDDVDLNNEGDTLTITAVGTPSHGAASDNGNGTITYTPSLNYNGSDSFTYTVEDAAGASATFTVTVTVNPINDAPVVVLADDQSPYIVDEGAATISIEFIVTDVDNDTTCGTTEVTFDTATNNYILVREGLAIRDNVGESRYIDVTPYRKWNGTAIITITANDGALTGSTIFTYVVNSVNDTPVGDDVAASTAEDSVYSVEWADITDDEDIITNGDILSVEITSAATHGTAVVDGDDITYTPDANWNGTDSFVYTVSDNHGATDTGTVTVTVTPVADTPVADDDSATTPEDTAVSIDVLNGDTDIDSDVSLNTHPDAHPELQTLSIDIDDVGLTNPSHGSIEVVSGEIVYTPDANFNGTDSFTYNVTDNTGLKHEATVSVTISQVNDTPVAAADTASTNEDNAVSIDVLANDTDIDQNESLNANPSAEVLSISIDEVALLDPAHGGIAVVSGRILYTPDANWFGTDTFEYNVDDGDVLHTATVTVTVNPINDLPVFTLEPDDMALTEDLADGVETLTVSDIETAGADLVVIATSDNSTLVDAGDITITADGGGDRTITIDPNDDQNGTATITVRVTDADGGYTECTFVVTVAAVNDAPAGGNDTATTAEDTAVTINATDNDDVDESTNPGDEDILIISVDDPAHGTAVAVNGNKDILYTPDANWNGTESFDYTVEDADLVQATFTVTVTVTPVADTPVADDDSATTPEDTAVSIDVLNGDTDIDSDVSLNTHPDAHPELQTLSIDIDDVGLTDPSHGSIAVVSGEIVYTPNANFNGTDSFTYNVTDNTGLKHEATVSVTITQVNDAPVAAADMATTNEDNAVSIDVLANDTDIDQNESLNANPSAEVLEISITEVALLDPLHGDIEIVGGQIVYTPDANWFGTDTFEYNVDDGDVLHTATVTVTVNSVNDLPVFTLEPDDMALTEDLADGVETLTVADIETAGADLVVIATSDNTTLVDAGDITITADGGGDRTITIDPNDDQNGTATITVRVTDADGGYTECTFVVTVAAVNDAPTGDDAGGSISEDGVYSIAWDSITDDVDIVTNGDTLSVAITTAAGHGTAAVDGSNITYTPSANWNGTDTFVYTVTDSGGLTDTGTITVTVGAVNDEPTADNDSDTIDEDTGYTVDWTMLTDDVDIATNGDTLGVEITGAASHGTASVDGDNITYTPDENYNGADSFVYTVTDGGGLTDTGTITIVITQVNDNPNAADDSASTTEDTLVTINALSNDTDVDTIAALNEDDLHDAADITITAVGSASNGSTAIVSGNITYMPDEDYNGVDTFTYTISDGNGGTDTGTVTVTVGATNDAPNAVDDTMKTAEDNEVSHDVIANDTDVDGDTLSFVEFLSDVSSFGTISATTQGVVTFVPKADYNGSFDVGYRMSDGTVTDTATITITVTAVVDAPVADDASKTTAEDTPVGVDTAPLISDVDDADDSNLTVSVEAGDGPAHGAISVSGYVITYTPDANYNGADSFVYTVTDNTGLTDTATVTMTVTPVNDTPIAADDAAQTAEDTPVSIAVLENDTDVDMDSGLNATPQGSLGIATSLGSPSHGSVAIVEGEIVYTPNENYNGTDSFTYYTTDGSLTALATVSVTIGQVNDNPAANPDTAQTTDGDLVSIDVLANDMDTDAVAALNEDDLHSLDDLTITGVSTPTGGTAVINGGKVDYTAGATFVGVDTFTYDISDGHGGSATATVTVTVLSANDPPNTPIVHTPAGGEVVGADDTITVTWTGFDIDGDTLTYILEYFDGTQWHVVATGLTETTYDFDIPESQQSVSDLQFRVNANDGEFTSDYGYSGHVMVDKDAPTDIVVDMTKADGSTYLEGTWTNQSVTVVATDITDVSDVTFSYATEDMNYAAGDDITVTSGVHEVFIRAEDEFGNVAEFGGYLIKIDKRDPAVPNDTIALDGTQAVITFTLNSDPGGSGNRYLIMPDGTRVAAENGITWTTDENGTYEFVIGDVAGNSTTFEIVVDVIDETPPSIRCDANGYSYGDVSAEDIIAALIFSDSESDIIAKGFAVSESASYSGVYQSYAGDITIGNGQFYIHAFGKNAFGLTAYETFGPFIVEIEEPMPEVGEQPPSGDVVIDFGDDPDGEKLIRLPGGEWGEELVLEDVAPGVYLVEIMDENGNVNLVEITITDEDIAAGRWNADSDAALPWWLWVIACAALLILLLLLLLIRNVRITVYDENGRAIRRVRKLRRKKDEVTVDVPQRKTRGGVFGRVVLTRAFTKRMRERMLIVEIGGSVVLTANVPEDAEGRFEARIERLGE